MVDQHGSTLIIKRPETNVHDKAMRRLRTLANLSLSFVVLTTASFILACIFFLVEAIMAGPHTHSDNHAEVVRYVDNIANFWPIILGGCLFGVGFILMLAKFVVQMYEIPLLREFAEDASEIRAIFVRYQGWKNGAIAAWLSINILMGMITDNNVVHFCRSQRERTFAK